MDESNNKIYPMSKKIFFVYPVGVVYDLLKDLLKNGYEVYVIKEHQKLIPLLEKFPSSIVYLNIFEKMNEEEWEEFIKKILDNENINNIQMGICTYRTNEDEELSTKYLMEFGLTGGYINLHINYKKSLEMVLKILEATEARGRRKYVRAKPYEEDNNTYIMAEHEGKQTRGKIKDLSVYAFAVEFEKHFFVKNQILRNVLVKLRGSLINIDFVVKGYHSENDNIYILIALIKNDDIKDKIFDYIFERLQTEIQNC